MASKIEFPTKEKIITTPIWLKLFATNMVANSFFGRCSNFEIRVALEESSSDKVFKSCWVREKRATSAADTMAEQNKRNAIAIIPKSKLVSIVAKKVVLGSESNEVKIS